MVNSFAALAFFPELIRKAHKNLSVERRATNTGTTGYQSRLSIGTPRFARQTRGCRCGLFTNREHHLRRMPGVWGTVTMTPWAYCPSALRFCYDLRTQADQNASSCLLFYWRM